jgi:hypothetical protein
MRVDRLERLGRFPFVPNVKPPIVRRSEDICILTIVLDLRSSGVPVTERQRRFPRLPQIPAVDIPVHGTRGEDVGMVRREIDVRNRPAMALQGMLDSTIGGILP